MTDSQPYDDRHGIRVSAPIATAKEPPTEPATPPGNAPMGEEVWEQRENERRGEAEKDRRGRALEMATRILGNDVNVYTSADDFVRYIETGEHGA